MKINHYKISHLLLIGGIREAPGLVDAGVVGTLLAVGVGDGVRVHLVGSVLGGLSGFVGLPVGVGDLLLDAGELVVQVAENLAEDATNFGGGGGGAGYRFNF